VATWIVLGAFWDFMEAFTEGIGEAAANQVAFLLSLGHAEVAKDLSYSAVYWACIQSLLVTSGLLMSGQYLAVLFSTDPTIQHLFNNTIAMISAANVAMTFSQINWSLVGSQGRFRLATVVIFFSRWFVIVPVAAVSIFGFNLNLNAVAGSLVVGYSTASSALLFILLNSDWDRLASIMRSMSAPANTLEGNDDNKVKEKNDAVDPALGELDLDDFEDSSDDSDGFGVSLGDNDE
jgi:Na+-driven multidrug efflux pump